MKNIQKINFLPIILIVSILLNFYFLYSNSSLEKKKFCAQFKDQVADRIRTYYTNGDTENVYPAEIFYSKKIGSCVAVWEDYETNPAGNGYTIHRAIIDAITNKGIYSEDFFHFNDQDLKEEQTFYNKQKMDFYNYTLEKLR